jgi:adenylate cyclase
VDSATVNYVGGMRQTSYDTMMRLRVNVPAPSDDIVIIDIDEKTLAAMAQEYGRWPWPRQVLAEFVEKVSAQKPQAIVFDVLFSDPDIQNPDSDAYFNDVMAATPNTFFPMLRLDPSQDGQSALTYALVPGAQKADPAAADSETVALVIPPFAGVQQPGRLGTNNVYPDADGVARAYPGTPDRKRLDAAGTATRRRPGGGQGCRRARHHPAELAWQAVHLPVRQLQ